MSTTIDTDLRKAPLPAMVEMLRAQQDVRYDVVVPAARLRYQDGFLHVIDGAATFDETPSGDLVAGLADARLSPTPIFEEGLSEKLGIPRKYLERLRETGQRVTIDATRSDDPGPHFVEERLLDANVNAWFQADPGRKYLVRAFRTDNVDEVGIARALLSDRYGVGMDNLDTLFACLSGAREAGIDTSTLTIDGDLTERRMQVRISAPQISVMAPVLLNGYRSPFSGLSGTDLPVVFAGVVIGNSETGGGAFTVDPRLVVQVCTNGMVRKADGLRKVHLGGQLQEGVVEWSDDTRRKALEVVTATARDAVRTFLSTEYLEGVVREVEQTAGTPVTDAAGTIERVSRAHQFTEAEQASILDCFIKGGQMTAGGVMQAVTAAAQNLDADRASEFEESALDVLATAAAL